MKIQILMSTYNGAPYLRTQLDSIVTQTVPEKALLIRDDGSSDSSVEILEEYHQKYPWISYYKGENVGVQKSFFDLIACADPETEYFALADQDDQWMPEKLEWAMDRLSEAAVTKEGNEEIPLLYCSAQKLVDANLDPLNVTVSRTVRRPAFGNALVQNICTGCTAVGNQRLLELLKNYPPKNPEKIIMHDWWLYLTASCFGEVYYDQNAYIKYRQHGKNTFGVQKSRRDLLRYRLKELSKPRGEIYGQVTEYWDSFFDEFLLQKNTIFQKEQQVRNLLSAEHCLKSRFQILFSRRYFRQKRSDDLVFRLIVLLGKL